MSAENPSPPERSTPPSFPTEPADAAPSASAAPDAGAVAFPPTRWTLVLGAAEGNEEEAQEALRELSEHYQSAIHGYFRIKCRDPHAAEDLTGKFMLHLLGKNRLRKFERRDKTRFRNYLNRSLKHFLYDHPPEAPSEDITLYLERTGEDPRLEEHIDAAFAIAAHGRAMTALRDQYVRHGKGPRMERLTRFILQEPEGDDYPQAAADLNLSVNALYQAVFRLRHDFYDRFRAEIAQTVQHQREELEEETRYLVGLLPAALAESGPRD